MTIQERVIYVSGGRTAFGVGFLLFSKILKLKREGIRLDGITVLTSWTSRDYIFNPAHGVVTLNPAEPIAAGGENIYILFKT